VRREFAAALLLNVVGAALALLVSTRTWQRVTIERTGLVPVQLRLTGRNLDGALTPLAVAALAAVVAVVATRAVVRRAVGGLTALVGVAIVWRAVRDLSAVSAARARSFAGARHLAVTSGTVRVHVTPAWVWLAALAGLLVAVGGGWTAVRGQRWRAMPARYEAPVAEDDETTRARQDLSMWNALDRGDDPTS
jgi:uncharacterized membrane protein (TIGR02234 family)